MTKGDLYSLVTKARLDDISANGSGKEEITPDEYTFTVYADGDDVVPTTWGDKFDDVRNTYFLSNSSAAAGEKDTNAVSGKGVQTEVTTTRTRIL